LSVGDSPVVVDVFVLLLFRFVHRFFYVVAPASASPAPRRDALPDVPPAFAGARLVRAREPRACVLERASLVRASWIGPYSIGCPDVI
jgi:hypothetical protein